MQLKKKPVTGMKDILPQEMEIRDYVIGLIKDTYKQFGFTSMEAPCVEHIENLTSKQRKAYLPYPEERGKAKAGRGKIPG